MNKNKSASKEKSYSQLKRESEAKTYNVMKPELVIQFDCRMDLVEDYKGRAVIPYYTVTEGARYETMNDVDIRVLIPHYELRWMAIEYLEEIIERLKKSGNRITDTPDESVRSLSQEKEAPRSELSGADNL
jgi:hypothetical protein